MRAKARIGRAAGAWTCILLLLAVTAVRVAAQGMSWGPGNSTVITSKSMTFEYQERTAVFQGNVRVSDPQIKILSDMLTVTFDATNAPDTVTAVGNVRIWQNDRVATAKQAVYSVKSGLMVLTGNPVLTRPGDRMQGKRFVFYRDSEKVTGDEVSISINSGTTNNLAAIFEQKK